MTDITKIMNVINKINSHCKEIDELEASIRNEYLNEKQTVDRQTEELIAELHEKYDVFKAVNFLRLKSQINDLVTLLRKDYSNISIDDKDIAFYEGEKTELYDANTSYMSTSYEEASRQLEQIINMINVCVLELNNVDFDRLVPPEIIVMNGESFKTMRVDRSTQGSFDCDSLPRDCVNDPGPIEDLVKKVLVYCNQAILRIDALMSMYDREFAEKSFKSYVKGSAKAWISEFVAKMRGKYSKRFDELFGEERPESISKKFFTVLEAEGKMSEVDMTTGSASYNESITLGNVKLLVEDNPKHLGYMKESSVLNRYAGDGYISAPLILDLKSCGNILLNINEEDYSEQTVSFVNQLIIQFLLSFPANRIKFCLIDIDNKMSFSQFKSLTKINNSILFNGIIRDDRQLDDTIKDMEQTMYKIDDDILSYNNVEDIYEYNKKYEANPQNVYLFVLVNYPSGMRDDTAKRVLKIIQNGNKAGIFSVIINNKACSLAPGYKNVEYEQFVENAKRSSLVITKCAKTFSLNLDVKNYFVPKNNISISALPGIVEMLKDSAESNRQKVVPLSQMFEDTDAMAASAKGIPSSAVMLDIPIGARGGEVQTLRLVTSGDGSPHAVVIGGTGSGKSNLLHAIIMNACYKYSPEELNLYIVDFKGGVEFKFYEANGVQKNQIPHIKLTGLTSDLEDGVAILANLQRELWRRENEFRGLGVEGIVQYRNLGKKIPSLFVIVDEIQELFERNEALGQKAINILSELFKKGRSFGINLLWASQNVPKVPGLKNNILSQIGNRISLRLNDPDDAIDVNIDPKAVKNLNRPEKGLGVINDIRNSNDSIEFRVAYAESSENRHKYVRQIIEKWKKVTDAMQSEPLYIVGDDAEPSAIESNTIYSIVPTREQMISKAFGSYVIQLGKDYISGKPHEIPISLRGERDDILIAGYDVEIMRDMMGYSLLSLVINHITNSDCLVDKTKIYYANGEMINPKNSEDLFNIIRSDFDAIVENVSSKDKMIECIQSVYKLYKKRKDETDRTVEAIHYAPCFVVIHSMQRYLELFEENPTLNLVDTIVKEEIAPSIDNNADKYRAIANMFSAASKPSTSYAPSAGDAQNISFSSAFADVLDKGGRLGIHFIISIDNPLELQPIKTQLSKIVHKIFVKGVNANVLSQLLGDYKAAGSLNNPKVALVSARDERTKVRLYRYETERDASWYKVLRDNYKKLLEE